MTLYSSSRLLKNAQTWNIPDRCRPAINGSYVVLEGCCPDNWSELYSLLPIPKLRLKGMTLRVLGSKYLLADDIREHGNQLSPRLERVLRLPVDHIALLDGFRQLHGLNDTPVPVGADHPFVLRDVRAI